MNFYNESKLRNFLFFLFFFFFFFLGVGGGGGNERGYELPPLTKGFSSHGVNKKLHLKQSRGNNSETMKARVAVLVRDLWS